MPIIIQVFSDYVCPYCYLGEVALERAADATGAKIVWRAYQLQASNAQKFVPGEERKSDGWRNFIYPMAEALSIEIHRPSRTPLTRLAHEAAAWARTQNRFNQFHQQLFKAFFQYDMDFNELAVLKDIARQAGLDPDEMEKVLAEHRMADDVDEDLMIGRTYGINIVPTFVIGGHLFCGVQEEEVLIKAIELTREGKLATGTRKLPHVPIGITRL